MKRLRWHLHRLWAPTRRALRQQIALAMLIGGVALACKIFWESPLRAGLAARDAARPAPVAADGTALRDFYAPLRAQPPLTEQLAKLDALARTNGIALRGAEYRLEPMGELALSRYHIVLPLRAAYPALRRFAFSALAELPALALDGLELRVAEGGLLDARLHFVLYLPR